MTDEKKQIKILIVDDEEEFLQSIAERFAIRDFEVTTASEGKQAIAAAKKGRYDVALLDLQMPGMDGKEVLKLMKKKHKFLEVIMLTGHGSIDAAVECTKLGAFKFIEKPFDFERLLELISEAYTVRMKKKFEYDERRRKEIEQLSMGSSPAGILNSLRRLREIDDDEK
ncbi:MAG: response regulator [Planctomycetota bacterium]